MLSKAKDPFYPIAWRQRAKQVSMLGTLLRCTKYILARSCWDVKSAVDGGDPLVLPRNSILTHTSLGVNTPTGRRVRSTRSRIGGVA